MEEEDMRHGIWLPFIALAGLCGLCLVLPIALAGGIVIGTGLLITGSILMGIAVIVLVTFFIIMYLKKEANIRKYSWNLSALRP